MERTTINTAKELFGNHFLGLEELSPFFQRLGFSDSELQSINIPEIPFSVEKLQSCAIDYMLILGVSKVKDTDISIRFLREKMGIAPDVSEPCFYNQDWYLNEKFIDNTLENKWYLIKTNVLENARAIQPQQLIDQGIAFPSTILCAYTFFANFFHNNTFLWEYDFVWCSDTDHNGDRVYVGKYRDVDGVNKNGFSIHRHLALRSCYSAVEVI